MLYTKTSPPIDFLLILSHPPPHTPGKTESSSLLHPGVEAGTPYDGGSFHIKLVLGNDFPHSPPRGFFLTKIYHPNVAANGDICVNTLKRDWTAEVTLTHVLQVCHLGRISSKPCFTYVH